MQYVWKVGPGLTWEFRTGAKFKLNRCRYGWKKDLILLFIAHEIRLTVNQYVSWRNSYFFIRPEIEPEHSFFSKAKTEMGGHEEIKGEWKGPRVSANRVGTACQMTFLKQSKGKKKKRNLYCRSVSKSYLLFTNNTDAAPQFHQENNDSCFVIISSGIFCQAKRPSNVHKNTDRENRSKVHKL